MYLVYTRISQSGQYHPLGDDRAIQRGDESYKLNYFLLRTYVPIHFFMVGGVYHFSLHVGGKDKKFGNHWSIPT